MNLQEVKAAAQKILDLQPTEGYTHKAFTTNSGGSPSNKIGLKEVARSDSFKYRTTANGNAYGGEVVISCREIGGVDAKGNTIYEAEDGTCFVYLHEPGSPSSFDRSWFARPNMTI